MGKTRLTRDMSRLKWIGCGSALLLYLASGCSTSISLNTVPEGADVYLFDEKARQSSPVGKTPLSINPTLSGDFLNFEIVKPGYETVQVVSPNLSGYSGTMNVILNVARADTQAESLLGQHRPAINRMMSEMFRLQDLILNKELAQAEELIGKYDAVYQELAMYHLLKGNLSLLQGNRERAVISYRRALALDSKSKSAIWFLRSLGMDVSASQESSEQGGGK